MEESPVLEGLNPAQREAVTHVGGPLLVVAGAGSGKTRVLTRRIAYLIDACGLPPYGILAITFTNKAADEMKHRVGSLVGPVISGMWVSTFHSACVRILRSEAERIGYPSQFVIYDQADSVRLCRYVLDELDMDAKRLPPRQLHARISALKNEGVTAEGYADQAAGPHEERISLAFAAYQRRLLAAAAMDFDDLLLNTVALFQGHDDALARWRRRFSHVLVDEYQDTNKVQNRLVIQLAAEGRQVTVVGDSDQSIYAFRGADMRNLLDFEHAFPDARIVVLDQNYRSTQTILNAANAVIANNAGRNPKKLWTDRGSGQPVAVYQADNEHDEARFVVSDMRLRHASGLVGWDEVAVFYRTNAQSRVLEEHLVDAGIPYMVVGGARFYDRREVRDAIAYLKTAVNPDDEVSAKRALSAPRRGIGPVSVAKVDAYAAAEGIAFHEALRRHRDAGVTGRASSGIEQFCELIDSAAGWERKPGELIAELLKGSGYSEALQNENTFESEGRLDNLSELVGMADAYDTIDAFLEKVALTANTDNLPTRRKGSDTDIGTGTDDDSKVTLMTLHTAKGLEYSEVYLTGMEDGLFPHSRSLVEPEQMEEERRLAYVGITRAMRRLTVTHARCRQLHGMTLYNPPSCFLFEIPDELMDIAPDGWAARGMRRGRTGATAWSPSRDRTGHARQRTGRGRSGSDCEGAAGGRPGPMRSGGFPRLGGAPGRRFGRAGRGQPTDSGADGRGLRVGDDVRHGHWGDGVIVSISGSGDSAEAVVRFPSEGEKRLLLSWAPLKKI